MKKDVIAAIATGLTDSGIGVIRISGLNAVEVGDGVFRLPNGKRCLRDCESHVMHYGFAVDQRKGFAIDEVMAVVMRSPRSFTGEDTVELQCHGGVFVMERILEAVLENGARLAEPGEFTKRAFLNGRMDLSRAEAVMDVIESRNEAALRCSVNQLRGALWEKVKELRSVILYEMAFIESALDDPEHISLEGYPEKLKVKIEDLSKKIEKLIDTADHGRLVKAGIDTVIIGKPNVGKSSFLNLMLGEERAIVTDVAGTTRDLLTESVRLGELCLNMADTAGIRDTEDAIEKIGVERAKKYAEKADLIVFVADVSRDLDENDREIAKFIGGKNVIVLLNKSDLEEKTAEEDIRALFEGTNYAVIRTSAKKGVGMEEFEEKVKEMFFHGEVKSENEVLIMNLRHKEALKEALHSLCLVRESIEKGMPEDFYTVDLMDSYGSLGRIIGEEVDDALVEEIFSKFCLGK